MMFVMASVFLAGMAAGVALVYAVWLWLEIQRQLTKRPTPPSD